MTSSSDPNGASNSDLLTSDGGSSPVQSVLAHATHLQFELPLPPPQFLREYDVVVPGLAERIVAMTERENAHRHDIERGMLTLQHASAQQDSELRKRGQLFGFVIANAGLFATLITAWLNQPWVAGILGGATLIGLVTVFVTGARAVQSADTPPAKAES